MTVLIGTGNAVLDAHLKKYINDSGKVNYLEEINNQVGDLNAADVVILSSFLPSVNDDTEQEKTTAFNFTLKSVLDQGVRVVFLTDMTFPLQDLTLLFDLGIYDFIVSEDGNVDLADILKKVETATTKEEAQAILDEFAKKQSPLIQKGKLKNADNHELYQHLEYKEVAQEVKIELPILEKQTITTMPKAEQEPVQVVPTVKEPQSSTVKATRQKSTEKGETTGTVDEAKTFAFWGNSTNLGKRTLSQSFAMQIAKMGYNVLYVELDYLNSTLALTTALTNPDKNFYQLSLSQDSFDLDNFIANKMDVRITKEMLPLFNEIPEEFHFLGLPGGFEADLFPSITNEGFLSTLVGALKEVDFDAVVINLPNEIDNLFSFPVMLESDVVFAVTTVNPIRVNEYRAMKKMLADTPLNMNKWQVIVNQVGNEISKDVCDQILREQSLLAVPYDLQRGAYELDLRFGSPTINQKMVELANLYGFFPPEPVEPKKKGLFKKR